MKQTWRANNVTRKQKSNRGRKGPKVEDDATKLSWVYGSGPEESEYMRQFIGNLTHCGRMTQI